MTSISASSRTGTILFGAGVFVRYVFYALGIFVLGAIALGIMAVLNYRPTLVDAEPTFRLNAPEFARLGMRTEVVTSGRVGRSEARHYGQIFHRDRDMTIIMVMPPKGQSVARDFVQELRAIPILRDARAILTPIYHDLDTRFGAVTAAEMGVVADGRAKHCLAYLSRFDTAAVYLKGWLCEANGSKPSPHTLACLLHGLMLDKPLAAAEADAFIRGKLGRGSSCGSTPVSQTVDTRPRRPVRRY